MVSELRAFQCPYLAHRDRIDNDAAHYWPRSFHACSMASMDERCLPLIARRFDDDIGRRVGDKRRGHKQYGSWQR
jgi:hypothetical protein